MGKKSRTKGVAWERDIAQRLTIATCLEHNRVLTEYREASHDVSGPTPTVNQCKIGLRPNPRKALEEALAVTADDELAIAWVKFNRQKGRPPLEMACVTVEDMMRIVGVLDDHDLWHELW